MRNISCVNAGPCPSVFTFIHEVTHTYVQDYFIVEGTIIINRLLLLTSNFVPVL